MYLEICFFFFDKERDSVDFWILVYVSYKRLWEWVEMCIFYNLLYGNYRFFDFLRGYVFFFNCSCVYFCFVGIDLRRFEILKGILCFSR